MRAAPLVLLAACGGGSLAPAPAPVAAPLDAAPRTFNDAVLALLDTYEPGGAGGYVWPAEPGTAGTTRDLVCDGEVIARAGAGSHCVGITLEVFWRALADCPGGVDAALADAAAFKRTWYVPDFGGLGAVAALVDAGLGDRIAAFDDARPGDFVQAWTADQSQGHSMIFTGWDRDPTGAITGIRYWSSQPWTDGIGHSSMSLDDAGFDPAQVYIARARCPDGDGP